MSIVDLKKIFMSLSYSDKKELLEILEHSNQIDSIREDIDESRFSEGIFCPHCGCTENIVKFGKYNSIQRYKCKNCNSTFSFPYENCLREIAEASFCMGKVHRVYARWTFYL